MAAVTFGQGMVRPGAWANTAYADGYLDRQYQIAKTVEALHTDLASFWARRTWEAAEDRLKITQMFVNTSADFQATWITSTQAPLSMVTSIVSRPLPPPCQLCDRPNPHTHHDSWRWTD